MPPLLGPPRQIILFKRQRALLIYKSFCRFAFLKINQGSQNLTQNFCYHKTCCADYARSIDQLCEYP